MRVDNFVPEIERVSTYTRGYSGSQEFEGVEMQRELLRLVAPYSRMQGQSTSADTDTEGEICASSGTEIEGQTGLRT